jgi:hypothetical protein
MLPFYVFQIESNQIEGIDTVKYGEPEALWALVQEPALTVKALEDYVAVIQPDARLRSSPHIPNVRVGNYVAPQSGLSILGELHELLEECNAGSISPHRAHVVYENLHPFTDGNGRSGRALWLWLHKGRVPGGRSFLHQFYYETLEHSGR